MPYGVTQSTWNMLPQEDRDAIIAGYQAPVVVVPVLPPAPPAPALPPALPPAQFDPGLLAAAGVTPEQAAAADQAGIAAAAGAAALLQGEGSVGIAAAEQAAGASQDVVDGLLALGIPDITSLVVGDGSGPDGSVGDTGDVDAAGAVANGNTPDLSGLPSVDVLDLSGLVEFSTDSAPLKGGSALTAIAQACSDFGIDAIAAIADALHEGAGGGVGDNGRSYGPFQMEIGGALPAPYNQRGLNNPTTNAWAWTTNGIRFAVRGMATAKPSAKGLRGHSAVYAIVYGFERPTDEAGAYATRAKEYDHLIGLGSGWAAYAAPLFAGPSGGGAVDTQPIAGSSSASYQPAGVVAKWRDLVNVFRLTVPSKHATAQAVSDSLLEVFR